MQKNLFFQESKKMCFKYSQSILVGGFCHVTFMSFYKLQDFLAGSLKMWS